MIAKQLALRFKIRTFIVMHYHFMVFKIKDLKKEYELGKISKDYLDGYLRGITDFKDNLIKADMSTIK
ncbi:hypothetical protein [Peptoniphilus lacrimalis]|uniref:hypothetical protein n=1 Tax=Peptoniphilus lacrimalis TaxID=33031 RepID=UPI0023F7C0A1|nr:hypothetical protein [Peptoniphilus lacrimalis]